MNQMNHEGIKPELRVLKSQQSKLLHTYKYVEKVVLDSILDLECSS